MTQACATAHVGRGTFYRWKPRFEQGGYPALEQPYSRARKHSSRKGAAIEAEVIALRQSHPGWGKKRIADELAKVHSWHALVSANTVKRILSEVGLWAEPDAPPKTRVPQ